MALSPCLVVDWITTLLLKEPDGRLLGLPSSNHNRSNHCADSQASRGKDQRALMFWWWVTRKLWSRGHWEWFDSDEDRPRCTFMPCHRVCGGYACWVWGHFYRKRSVANPQRQLLMLGPLQCSSTPETSLQEEENFEASYENKFRSIFYFTPFPPFYYFILLIATLWGTFSLMLAIKFCSAQLNHQDGAMTAGPHAARVTQTESQKIAWNVFTQVPSVPSCDKQYKNPAAWQTTKSHSPRPSQRQTHWNAGGHSSSWASPATLITQCNLFLVPVYFPHITAVLFPGSRQTISCFTYLTTNPSLSAFSWDQQEGVNSA